MADDATALFGSETFPEVLAVLTVDPRGSLSVAELTRRLGSNRESTQRALGRLTRLGLVTAVRRANQVFFEIDRTDPSFGDLLRLSQRFAGLGARLSQANEVLGMGMIDHAFMYGSAAALTSTPSSDLDVFVIGDARLDQVAPFLEGMEAQLGRPIHVVCRTRAQVVQGLMERRRFYANVWEQPRVMLVGREGDLPNRSPALV